MYNYLKIQDLKKNYQKSRNIFRKLKYIVFSLKMGEMDMDRIHQSERFQIAAGDVE